MSQVTQLQLTPKGCTGCMLEASIKMLPKEDERCQPCALASLMFGPLRKSVQQQSEHPGHTELE